MKLDNIKAQMRKGVLELCILSMLEGDEMYTSDMIRKLKSAELIVVEGTLYPLLSRLKNAGVLSYNWKESSSGPPRKYFQLTNQGKEVLHEMRANWEKLNRAVHLSSENQSSQ